MAELMRDPAVMAIARQLLGDVRPPGRTRGIYTVFPQSAGATLSPHCDQVRLGCIVALYYRSSTLYWNS